MPGFRRGLPRRGRVRVAAALAAATLPFSIAACGDDDTAGPETGIDVQDITKDDDQYFADDRFVGDRVTISAEVEEVLTPQSFRLDGGDWGDESLLVVSAAQAPDLQDDDVVQVTGTVRQFIYDDYADEYGLAEDDVYDPYAGEEFIEASTVDMTAESDPAPTT